MFLSMQTNKLCNAITCALSTIESYIRDQVVSAIGKEVQPSDFAEYMDYHYSRLFREAYRPQPFCFSIRRPNRFPQGSISIESFSNSSWDPIRTSVMKAPSGTQRACLSHPVARIRLLQQQLTLRHRYHVISLECCHECTFQRRSFCTCFSVSSFLGKHELVSSSRCSCKTVFLVCDLDW